MRNNLITENLRYDGGYTTATHVHIISYTSAEINETVCENISEVSQAAEKAEKLWLRVHGFKNTGLIEEICRLFSIDFLTVQDILNVNHPSKIDSNDDFNFIVSRVMSDEGPLQLRVIQGSGYVLSFTEGESSFFDDIHKALKANTLKIRNRSSDYLLSVMVNGMISYYISTAMDISDQLEDMETALLSSGGMRDMGAQIQAQRHRYMELKRIVIPLKDQYSKLLTSDAGLISEANRPFFNDVNDHIFNASQLIESCRETLSSLMDLYISDNDLRMNDIMKRLTIVSTIFIPLTFLVGVWGMNFKSMPELEWEYGYIMAWAVMIVTGIAAYFIFRTKRWR